MGHTDAERQRRRRAHVKGDHSLCDPSRCDGRETPARVTPERLGRRGTALWNDLDGTSLPPAGRVLLEEACRLADRLDKLDDFLRGKEDAWLRFHRSVDDDQVVTVIVDKALSEARQQQVTLARLMAELRPLIKAEAPTPGVSVLDQLAARRAARSSGAAG